MIKCKVRLLLLLFLGLFSAGVFAQGYPKDFLTHKILVNHDDRTIEAYVKPVKLNSTIPDRDYYWFSGKQIKNTHGGYGGKPLNGEFKEYDLNKGLRTSGMFLGGLKSGVWKSWRENGKLIEDYTWKLGQKNGTFHKYDSLGKVTEFGEFKKDLLQGNHTTMIGDSIVKVKYRQGKVVVPKNRMPGFIKRIFK